VVGSDAGAGAGAGAGADADADADADNISAFRPSISHIISPSMLY